MLDELIDVSATYYTERARALQRNRDLPGVPFYLQDLDYYHDKMLRDNFQVDHDLIAEYFPATVTIHR